MNLDPRRAVLLLVDIQPSLVGATMGGRQVLDRAGLLVRAARLLGVPILATLHVPEKLGGLHPQLNGLADVTIAKRTFSCARDASFRERLRELGRDQLLVAGFEAHVCVALTARDLAREAFEVAVLADAVASRTADRCEIALASLRSGGVAVEHSETALYALMESPDHPAFREVLRLVKASRY